MRDGIISFGLVLIMSLGLAQIGMAAADNVTQLDNSVCVVAPEVAGPDCGDPGDDNGDGWIMEDESGWDCRTMGNRLCGPQS